MKSLKFLIKLQCLGLIAGMMIFLGSCTKKFEEINTDQNSIATIGPAELPFLFSKAQSTATNSQWNYQVAQNLFADQYAQEIQHAGQGDSARGVQVARVLGASAREVDPQAFGGDVERDDDRGAVVERVAEGRGAGREL